MFDQIRNLKPCRLPSVKTERASFYDKGCTVDCCDVGMSEKVIRKMNYRADNCGHRREDEMNSV